MTPTFEQVLADHYKSLSPRLRAAGDYVVAHPLDVVTRSMRRVAQDAKMPPASFSRLARALGYDDYQAVRDVMRGQLGRRVSRFAARAQTLRSDKDETAVGLVSRHLAACQSNLEASVLALDSELLERTAQRLHEARRVVVVGALGSAGIAQYLAYIARLMGDHWHLAGAAHGSVVSDMARLGPEDAILVVTKAPCARESVLAAEIASKRGAEVIIVTDSHTSPALPYANVSFLLSGEGPTFFTSYVATVFMLESLVALLVRLAGPEAVEHMAEMERINRELKVVVDR